MPLGASRAGLMSVAVDDIPDLGLDHLYWGPAIDDVSQDWEDQDGGLNTSPFGSPSLDAINSTQAVSYDGSGDYHSADSWSLGSSGEYTFAIVFEAASVDFSFPVSNGSTNGNSGWRFRISDDGYQVGHPGVGSSGTQGTVDTDPHVAVGTFDGSNVIVDLDGVEIINESVGTPGSLSGDQSFIAAREDNDGNVADFFPGEIGAVGHEAVGSNSERRDEITNELGSPFGINTST